MYKKWKTPSLNSVLPQILWKLIKKKEKISSLQISLRHWIKQSFLTLELRGAFDMKMWFWIFMREIDSADFHIWIAAVQRGKFHFSFVIGFLSEWLWRTSVLLRKNWEKHHCSSRLLLFWIFLKWNRDVQEK